MSHRMSSLTCLGPSEDEPSFTQTHALPPWQVLVLNQQLVVEVHEAILKGLATGSLLPAEVGFPSDMAQ